MQAMGDRGNPQGPWQDYGRDAGRDERVPEPAPVPPVPARGSWPRWFDDYPDRCSDEWGYDEDPDDAGSEGLVRRAVGEVLWHYQSAPLWLRATLDVSAVALVLTFIVAGALTLSGTDPSDEVGAFVTPTSTTVRPAGAPTSAPAPLGTTTSSTTTEPPTTTTTVRPTTTVAPPTTPVPPPETTTRGRGRREPGPQPHYDNCFEAWRAGALPLHRGDPGYGPHLDDDDDGIACEWGEGT
jgi:hypothetical protein